MTIDMLNRDSVLTEWLLLSMACLTLGIVISHLCRRNPGRAHAVLVLSVIAALITPLVSMVCGAFGLSLAWGLVLTVPPHARSYWSEQGLGVVPAELSVPGMYAHAIKALEHVPEGETIIVLNTNLLGPAALLHGHHLDHPLILQHHIPDPYITQQWKQSGLTWVLALVPDDELEAVDHDLRLRGLVEVTRGLYAIP